MPRRNGKVEYSRREDQTRFCDICRVYSPGDFGGQLTACQNRSYSCPLRPLNGPCPRQRLSASSVQDACQTYLLPFDGVADWNGIVRCLNQHHLNVILTFEANILSKPGCHKNDPYDRTTQAD